MQRIISHRGIHLDCKGAPLPIDVLLGEIERMAQWGINLLLIEYEDAFPYQFDPQIRSPNAYTPEQVAELLNKCKSLGIDVVPLVQTFGHMEFVLKHDRYAELSQTPRCPQSICPCLPEARELVLKMVDELLAAHPDCRWLHLGGDEVWDLGEGTRSRQRAEQIGKDGLYLEHMMPIVDHVAARGVRPILWDDMMRKWPMQQLEQLAPKVDLMVWSYRADPFARIGEEVLERFSQAGLRLWSAAAFKGADGAAADLPDHRVRAANLDTWARWTAEHDWQGMVATGWSRYNGLATYCDLWWAAPLTLHLACTAMRNAGLQQEQDWQQACREALGVSELDMDWAAGWAPLPEPRPHAAPCCKRRLECLRAIQQVAHWRRAAESLFTNRWLVSGRAEDPSRSSAWLIRRDRERAEELRRQWPEIQRRFSEALAGAMYREDIEGYLASRKRIGMQHLEPILAE